MQNTEMPLIEKARRLKQVEKEFRRFTYELKAPENREERINYLTTATKIGGEAFELRKDILLDFEKSPTIKIIDDDVKNFLKNIKIRKEKLYSVSWYEGILEEINKDKKDPKKIPVSISEFLLNDDELLVNFHSWFDMIGYYERKIIVGPLISASDLPPAVKKYFLEIREAYAYYLLRSSVALCRALLEMSLYAVLKRRGYLRETYSKVVDISLAKQDKLVELIRLATVHKLIDAEKKEMAHKIRKCSNGILHLKEDIEITDKDVFDVIRQTVEVLEEVYK